MTLTKNLPPALKESLRPVQNFGKAPYRAALQLSTYARLKWPKHPLKLHLGCGNKQLPGFINIDLNWSAAADYTCDIAKLPCPDNSVSRIENYHVIEHIPRPQAERVLSEWLRVLKPGGVLVMECPDFAMNIEELLAGNEESMYSIFGRQRFPGDAHHWGYTSRTLSELVLKVGFSEVSTPPAQDYHTKNEPCIRIEAIK